MNEKFVRADRARAVQLATLTMPRPEFRLRVTSGPLRGASFPVLDGLTIGRGPNVDIMIVAPGIGPRHAQIRCRPDGTVALVDLGSHAGTWSLGRRIDELELRDGTTFEVGGSRFVHATAASASGAYAYHRGDEPVDRTTIRTEGRLVLGPIPRAVYSGDLAHDVAAVREAWLCAARGLRAPRGMTSRILATLVSRLAVGYDGARPRFVQFVADLRATLSWSGRGAGAPVTVERLGVEGAAIRCDLGALAPGQCVWLELDDAVAGRGRVRFAGRVAAMTEHGVTIAFALAEPTAARSDTAELPAATPTVELAAAA